MSLARTLMNSKSAVIESMDVTGYDFSEHVTMESSWLDTACESLLTDIFNVDKAFAVADVMGEVQVLKEGADPEVILESIVKGGIKKLADAFKKFWAKLKAWFAKVKDFLKKIFLSGKKFIDEFEDKLRLKGRDNANYKGFSYETFKYNLTDGDKAGADIFDKVKSQVADLLPVIDDKGNSVGVDDLKSVNSEQLTAALAKGGWVGKSDNLPPTSEWKDSFLEKTIKKGSDESEVTENLAKTYRSGETEKSRFEEFKGNSLTEMIDLIKTFDKEISKVNEDEKKFDSLMKSIISKLDSVKEDRSIKGGDKTYNTAYKASGYINALLTIGKIPSTVKVTIYKEAAGEYEKILKKFLSYKPAKEGVDVEDDEDGAKESSLFESAYNFI